MSQQKTLKRSASFAGIGLHSGNRVTMTFLPAEPNTGIRFRRIDLEGSPEIEASIDHVSDTTRSTMLAKGNVRIHTVEHVLATFSGYGIDNAIVELDANEPPIGDGSARPYCQMVESAEIVGQSGKTEPYRLTEPIEVQMGESTVSMFPHHGLKISCTSADHDGRHTEYFSVEIDPDTWVKELSHARTFCFFDEIEELIRTGLIKGGSLANAVIIRDDAILTTEPLRYQEEFVRHKILDVLGDLSLLGRPVLGHIIAVKPSHSSNCELTRRIREQMKQPIRAAQSFAPPAESANGKKAGRKDSEWKNDIFETVYNIEQIRQILPHRYPFLMIDRVTRIEGNRIVAIKNVTGNEQYFAGHFPEHPVMPGVLQLEAIAQLAGVLMLEKLAQVGKIAYFMAADKVKWRKPVHPGDILVIDVTLVKCRGKIGKAKGACLVCGETVSEAEVSFMLLDER